MQVEEERKREIQTSGLHCFSLIFKVKIDTTTIPKVIILMADHSSLLKCNLNIGL